MSRVASLLTAFVFLFLPSLAWAAKFAPPPLTSGHVVTTAGWLSAADIRKVNEECELVHTQTGYVLDVLLADKLEDTSVQEAANLTFQTWKPQDGTKDNGILLFLAPNFPPGERKARIVAGTGVALTEAKAKEVLLGVIEPKINASDVRGAVAESIAALAKVLGGDLDRRPDAGSPVADAGAPAAAKPAASSGGGDDGGSPVVWLLVAALAAAVVGAIVYTRSRAAKGSAGS